MVMGCIASIVIDVDPYLLMIIPQLLDLSAGDWKRLIYFNINHVNDVPASRAANQTYAPLAPYNRRRK
jgi:hypothetical protein